MVGYNIPENECCLSHFRRKGWNICLDAIVHRYSSEELMNYWERGRLSWDKAANLSHHAHKSNWSYVCAFTAHIKTGDNLESALLSRVDIIRNIFLLVDLYMSLRSRRWDSGWCSYLFPDGVAPRFDCEAVTNIRSSIIVRGYQLTGTCSSQNYSIEAENKITDLIHT